MGRDGSVRCRMFYKPDARSVTEPTVSKHYVALCFYVMYAAVVLRPVQVSPHENSVLS